VALQMQPVSVSHFECGRAFARDACCCTPFRFMLATRRFPDAAFAPRPADDSPA
jgi:hypothetical protein